MSLEQQKHWYRENLSLKGQVIVDVGANVGELSQFFWGQCGAKGRLISVEPHPANIKALQKRIRKAGSKRWTLKRCAVSSVQGSVMLRKLRTASGDNAMVVDDGGDFTVACLPLTQIAPDATVIKLDVEGHEHVILPQAVPSMHTVQAWAVELHMVQGHALPDTLELFADHGFSLISAGQRRDDPSRWLNIDVSPDLSWDAIPGQRGKRDGLPHVFKMLHLIARR